MLEIEKKYLISKKTFISLFQSALIENRLESEVIDQTYLFKKNSKIAYNPDTKEFHVGVKSGDTFETIVVPVNKEEQQNKLQSFIELEDIKFEYGLYYFKGTYRIRFINGEPLFTFKRKVKESTIGQFEFEEWLTEPSDAFIDALSKLKSQIIKIRHKISVGELTYEIDFYQDFDFITLEVEFNNEDDYNAFVPDFEFTMDATNESSLKNKKLAKMLLKKKH